MSAWILLQLWWLPSMRRRPLPGSRGPKWMPYVSLRDINFWTNGIKREQRLSRWVKIVCCLFCIVFFCPDILFILLYVVCLFVLIGWFDVALLLCLLLLRPTTVKRYFFKIEYNLSYIVKKNHVSVVSYIIPAISHGGPVFIKLGRVFRKPVNVNPGLNVNWSIIFSCLKMFFTSDVWCSLRLLQLKTEGQTI